MQKKLLLLLAVLLPTLVACSGGGSGTGGTAATAIFTTQARIDLSTVDSDKAAAEGMGATASTSVGGLGSRGIASSDKTNNRIISLIKKIKPNPSVQYKTVSLGPQACSSGGTYTITYDDETFDFSAQYNSCVEFGETTSGSVSGSFSGSTFTMNFNSMTVVSSDFSMSMNGQMVMTLTTLSDHDHIVINGSNMIISMTYEGRSLSLGNYLITYDDYSALSYSVSDFSFDVNSAALGGSLRVETVAAIYQRYSENYPYQGQAKLSGANNASVLITAVDATSVRVQKDTDGDLIYESDATITWAALDAFLI